MLCHKFLYIYYVCSVSLKNPNTDFGLENVLKDEFSALVLGFQELAVYSD